MSGVSNAPRAVRKLVAPGFSPALEFGHLGLAAKNQLKIALARLRERGDREAVGEGFAGLARKKQPLTSGFAVPSPLGEGRYQLRSRRESKCPNSSAGL
jgi:hypothetical protein